MNWQSWIAGLMVAAAAGWVLARVRATVRQVLRHGAAAPGCGHCSRRRSTVNEVPLVTLGESGRSVNRADDSRPRPCPPAGDDDAPETA